MVLTAFTSADIKSFVMQSVQDESQAIRISEQALQDLELAINDREIADILLEGSN